MQNVNIFFRQAHTMRIQAKLKPMKCYRNFSQYNFEGFFSFSYFMKNDGTKSFFME